MPYLLLQSNVELDREQQLLLAAKASRLLAEELGKPESYVMVAVRAGVAMLFAGGTGPAAYLELKSIGLPEKRAAALSGVLSEFLENELRVPRDRVYIEFCNAQASLWGWNGATF